MWCWIVITSLSLLVFSMSFTIRRHRGYQIWGSPTTYLSIRLLRIDNFSREVWARIWHSIASHWSGLRWIFAMGLLISMKLGYVMCSLELLHRHAQVHRSYIISFSLQESRLKLLGDWEVRTVNRISKQYCGYSTTNRCKWTPDQSMQIKKK